MSSNARDVFISYSSIDKRVADLVVSAFEERGITCWIAPRDIPGGSDWDSSIPAAISSCRCFLLIFSGNADASRWVKSETNLATDERKPIIPLRIEDIKPANLRIYLAGIHWVDALLAPIEAHLEKVGDAVIGVLKTTPGYVPPVGVAPPIRKPRTTSATERAAAAREREAEHRRFQEEARAEFAACEELDGFATVPAADKIAAWQGYIDHYAEAAHRLDHAKARVACWVEESEKQRLKAEELAHTLEEQRREAAQAERRRQENLEHLDKMKAKELAEEQRRAAERKTAEAESERDRRAAQPTSPAFQSDSTPPLSRPGSKPGDRAELTLPGGAKMAFRWCPPGSFTMGSPASEAGRGQEENQVLVRLTKGFWMAETPITQAQYLAVAGINPSGFNGGEEKTVGGFLGISGTKTYKPLPENPVENVSWSDAVEFCRKLSQSSGRLVSLPTEAQWEYACRAGTTTPFHFGTTITPEQVNYNGNHPYGNAAKGVDRQKTTPVGSFPANAWGLHDMHGNVWEWCSDWYDSSLPGGTDPTGPSSGSYRVVRGGGWNSNARICRSAFRVFNAPTDRGSVIGFRPVLTVQ